jgi:transcriptional regulator with XRE-family HTH domain
VSNPYLSQIERGVKKPSAEILSQIAKGLRISAETLYVRAGILDDHQGSDVVAAILADVTIGERHKRTLIDVYESFRAEHGASPAPATKGPAKKATARKTTARKTAASKTTARKTTAKKRSTR